MNRKCRLCSTGPVSATRSEHFDLCDSCAATLGVMELPPPRRPSRPCNRCEGMRFIRVIPRDKTAVYDYAHSVAGRAEPMALTFVPRPNGSIFSTAPADPGPDPAMSRGRLETYVCATCGFVEWYCIEPHMIPIGPEYMSDVIDYTSDPYR
jgi:hypothetical protein